MRKKEFFIKIFHFRGCRDKMAFVYVLRARVEKVARLTFETNKYILYIQYIRVIWAARTRAVSAGADNGPTLVCRVQYCTTLEVISP
jgi:hypothetical protein